MKQQFAPILSALWMFAAVPALAGDTLYTLSNDPARNEVVAYRTKANGTLTEAGHYATGGTGTGAGLGNQGALAFNDSHRYLFAVNAGSNDVSVFRVGRHRLELIDRTQGQGSQPVSVAVDHDLVYVVNAGDDSIFGFRFDARKGKLKPLANSYRKLSGDGTGPAQIAFGNDGTALVVTEKASNKITTFSLGKRGVPFGRHSIDSAGQTPFGFAFGKRDRFFVAEAQGGAADASTVSSYQLEEDGTPMLIDGAVAAGQTAACWLATTPDGRMAFTADTPADAISAFAIDRRGRVSLLQPKAVDASRPVDLAVSSDGRQLFALNGGDHSIRLYRIAKGGKLVQRSTVESVPPSATGLVIE